MPCRQVMAVGIPVGVYLQDTHLAGVPLLYHRVDGYHARLLADGNGSYFQSCGEVFALVFGVYLYFRDAYQHPVSLLFFRVWCVAFRLGRFLSLWQSGENPGGVFVQEHILVRRQFFVCGQLLFQQPQFVRQCLRRLVRVVGAVKDAVGRSDGQHVPYDRRRGCSRQIEI